MFGFKVLLAAALCCVEVGVCHIREIAPCDHETGEPLFLPTVNETSFLHKTGARLALGHRVVIIYCGIAEACLYTFTFSAPPIFILQIIILSLLLHAGLLIFLSIVSGRDHVSPGRLPGFPKRGVCAAQLSCQSLQHWHFCSQTSARPSTFPSEPLSLRNRGQRDDGWRRSLTGKYSVEGVCCAGPQ